ncbi:MAG: hypothetical protein ACYTFI_23865 [Planctomycetota bacterium]
MRPRAVAGRGVRICAPAGLLLSLVTVPLSASAGEADAGANRSKLVGTGPGGKLAYKPFDGNGNIIPDFSNCGYMGGGVKIPDVPVRATLTPSRIGSATGADDTARLQAAIDRVAKLPARGGFRGTVLLKKGTYHVAGTLELSQSGVVLRGEGQHADGTVIIATGRKKRALVQIAGGGRIAPGTRREIVDAYVPVGARSFKVESTAGFLPGDAVVVHRPGTKEWIHDIAMDRIRQRGNTKQWTAKGYHFHFERLVTGIRGNTMTIDAPVVNAMEKKYGGGFVYKYTCPGRISHVGVEKLRLVSEYEKGKEKSDEEHAWDAVKISNVEHAWVRRVSAVHFGYSCVNVGRGAKHVTVEDCACLDPVSKITGARRYSFALCGQLTLVQRCYTRNGRHDYVMHARVPGPNAFVDCLAEKTHSDIGPHHRWAAGTLFDNIKGGAMNVQDRGPSGTGHGWAGAQTLFWNCVASSMKVDSPPTARNWAIGCVTRRKQGKGYWESAGTHVTPRSLYLRQLEDRLGAGAVRNVATASQLEGAIWDELKARLSK